jgi:hypothetical protein
MNTTTTHAATLQAENFDDLTWAMSVLAGEGDHLDTEEAATAMLRNLVKYGATRQIQLVASSALLGGRLATA